MGGVCAMLIFLCGMRFVCGFGAYICAFLLWVADRLFVSWLLLGVCYCVDVCWLLVLGWFFVVRFGWGFG